jgi:allophanate hydrolase subunit 1
VLGEKLGGEPIDRSASVLGIMSGALFLGSSRIRLTLLGQRERLPHTETPAGSVRVAYVD